MPSRSIKTKLEKANIPTASPEKHPHPILDFPKINEGDDSPSLITSIIVSYVIHKVIAFTKFFTNSIFSGKIPVVGTSCFILIYILPKIISYFEISRRRSLLKSLALKKRKLVAERNLLIVEALGLNKRRPKKEYKLTQSTASELLALMRARKVTCVEVVTAFCARAVQIQETLNCATEYCFFEAIETAKLVDAWRANNNLDGTVEEPPLLGLPISIKDLFVQEGYDTTCGCPCYVFDPADKDGETIQVLNQQGAIPYIRTNVPQAMMIPETDNSIYGKSLNPYNLDRVVGGSSGGEGGLIASFGSCLGIGTDIGGSIRIPAHNNGICGLKPSAERFTQKGSRAVRYDGKNGQIAIRATSGPLARSVDDLTLYMKAICNSKLMNELDPYRPPLTFNNDLYDGKDNLKLGYFSSSTYFPTAAPCKRAVDMAVEALRNKGHTCVDLSNAMPSLQRSFELYVLTIACDGKMRSIREGLYGEEFVPSYKFVYLLSLIPNFLRPAISFVLKHFLNDPRKADLNLVVGERSVYEAWQNIAELKKYRQHWVDTLKTFQLDGIVCPGGALPALRHGSFKDLQPSFCYTTLFNVLDWPTGTIPITTVTKEEEGIYDASKYNDSYDRACKRAMEQSVGLPIGVQVASLPFKDELVLRIMKEIEMEITFDTAPAL
jgi:fatty acid amide hydrolase